MNQQDSKSIYNIWGMVQNNKARTFLILTFHIKIVICFWQDIWYLILLCQTGALELHIPSVCIYEFFINYSDWNWIQA